MRYEELCPAWQRVFALAWESLLQGSKAIAAVIVSENGEIISEGRNRIAENVYPNARIAHAETEAVANLDAKKYPDADSYTLYAGLELCIMCFGTIVMGHVRKVVIAARDGYGGAMELTTATDFLRNHPLQIEYADSMLGYVQRTMQAFRELIKNDNIRKREHTLQAIRLLHPESVAVAENLVKSGYIQQAIDRGEAYENIFNRVVEELEKMFEKDN